MKKHLLFICLFIISCNTSTNENKTLDTSETTTITQEVTTTISQTTTSTVTTIALPTERSYEDNILKVNQYLLVGNIDSTVYNDSYYIRFKAKWNFINRLSLIFDNECESSKRPDIKESRFSSTLGINIKTGTNPCIQANEIIAIQIEGTTDNRETKFTTFYKNGNYTTTKYDKNHIDNAAVSFCCHKIDFIKVNLELKNLKDQLSNPPTTTTTSTSTTTTSTSTTTTLPSSADDMSPSWPNKEVRIANIDTDYVEVLWNTAEDNVNVAGYLFVLDGILWDYYERINDNNSIFLEDLNPNTTYNLEIYAYDEQGNTSLDNPKISFSTKQISSAVSGGIGGSSNVGGIPSNLTTISSLSGIKYSPIYIYPFNGYTNGLQEFTPRFDVRDENCEALEVTFKTSKGYELSDYIYIYTSSSNEGCFVMDKLIEIGYTHEAFVREEYLNRNGQGICDLWTFEEITIIYTNGQRLTYFRDGSVGYYENYVLKGLGNHNFNFFSEFDFETVNFSDTSDPNWEYRENQMVSCES